MPKFLFCGSYTAEGIARLKREGAHAERAVLEELVKGAAGTVEALYWAFGDDDLYLIADLPPRPAPSAWPWRPVSP